MTAGDNVRLRVEAVIRDCLNFRDREKISGTSTLTGLGASQNDVETIAEWLEEEFYITIPFEGAKAITLDSVVDRIVELIEELTAVVAV